MKRILLITFALLLTAGAVRAETPLNLAGITLGNDISRYDDLLRKETAVPLRDAAYVTEVNINPVHFAGVRGGSLSYGNCARKGEVLRIKLKFEDRSMDLFNDLLDLYKDTYGDPDTWKGDAFHNIIAWEWSFGQGVDRVTVLLMYSKIEDLRPGVSIKMTARGRWNEEQSCYMDSHEYMRRKMQDRPKKFDIKTYLPR